MLLPHTIHALVYLIATTGNYSKWTVIKVSHLMLNVSNVKLIDALQALT